MQQNQVIQMGRTAIGLDCPNCKNKLLRISYWNKEQKKTINSNEWFICLKCNETHQMTYSFKPRGKK